MQRSLLWCLQRLYVASTFDVIVSTQCWHGVGLLQPFDEKEISSPESRVELSPGARRWYSAVPSSSTIGLLYF